MLSNAEYLLALPALKLLCAKTDRYWLLLVRCLRLAQKTQNKRLSLTIKITHDKLQIVMNSKLGGSSPRRGEGPEAPSSRSEIRRIRIRSRTITTASWSDCFSQWQWQRQKQRGRWGRGHEWGHGGGCRWWCRMIQDDVRLFTQIFPKWTGLHCHWLDWWDTEQINNNK